MSHPRMNNTTISTEALSKQLAAGASQWIDVMGENVYDMLRVDAAKVPAHQRPLVELAQATGEEAAAKAIAIMPLALNRLAQEVKSIRCLRMECFFMQS